MTNDHRFVDPRGRSDGCGGGFRPAGFATNCAARKAAHLCNGACRGSGVRFCDSQRRIILMLPSESQNRTPDPGDFATVNIEGM